MCEPPQSRNGTTSHCCLHCLQPPLHRNLALPPRAFELVATAELLLQHTRLKDDEFGILVDSRLLKGDNCDLGRSGHSLIDVNPGGLSRRASPSDSSFVQRAVFQEVRSGTSTSQRVWPPAEGEKTSVGTQPFEKI